MIRIDVLTNGVLMLLLFLAMAFVVFGEVIVWSSMWMSHVPSNGVGLFLLLLLSSDYGGAIVVLPVVCWLL
jgi:hypothetical protein